MEILPLWLTWCSRWVHPVCGLCLDRREREQALREKIAAARQTCNLPGPLAQVQFAGLRVQPGTREGIRAGWEYVQAEPPSGWLLLEGNTGRGKTWLLGAICTALVDRGVKARYYRTDDVLEIWRRTNDYDSEIGVDARRGLDQVRGAEVLVLDEFGLYPATDKARRALDQLIDERYERHLPLVVATNLTAEERVTYSRRIADRLTDVELCTAVEVEGRSWRHLRQAERDRMPHFLEGQS